MIRAALLWLLLAGGALAQSPGHGLIENRTGLPLVFPLEVRTTVAEDAYLVMREAGSGEIAVTAYVEGGRFFRLLMPPGRYRLTAAMGKGWLGQDDLFGEETRLVELPEPLTFEIRGVARKQGHRVDLRRAGESAAVSPIALCQRLARRLAPAPPDPEEPDAPRSVAPEIAFSYPLPPGPRDPDLDGRPELGAEFGNAVPDVPLWLRLGEGRERARPARPVPPARSEGLTERPCG